MCPNNPDAGNIDEFGDRGGPESIFTDSIIDQMQAALLDTYFSVHKGQLAPHDLHDHVRGRFDVCRRWFVPWLQRYIDLGHTSIVEIGCGTGSTTAALAIDAKFIDAYDIAGRSIEAARRRMEIMKIGNVRFHEHHSDQLLNEMRELHLAQSVDCVVLFAVLEHQKHLERLATLRTCWDLLRPGGILVIGDTPNRLTWHDFHTSLLPFFNMLPSELALDYAVHSPRKDFRDAIAAARSRSDDDAHNTLARLGRGISYHEFELVFGHIEAFIVGDGFDPEPLSYFGVSLETRLLYTYVKRKRLRIPSAFLRDTIEIILRKPDQNPVKVQRRSTAELESVIRPLVDP